MNVFRVSKLSQNSFCVRCTDTTYVLRSATYTYQAMFFELECVWKHCNGACVDLCFSCAGRQGSIMYIVNPWRACAARVIVGVLCVCVCVRACVRACVSTHICRITHWNHTTEIPTGSQQYSDCFKFCRFS